MSKNSTKKKRNGSGTSPSPSLGSKGEETRQRIMDSFFTLLKTKHLGEIRISDITRMNGMVHSHFYAYFRNLDEVAYALGEQLSDRTHALLQYVTPDWSGPQGLKLAHALTEHYIAIWREYGVILHEVYLLADKLHDDFHRLRIQQYRPLYKAFEKKITAAQAAKLIPKDLAARALSYQIIGVMSTTGARYDLWRASGFSHGQIVDMTAYLLHKMATGETVQSLPQATRAARPKRAVARA